MPIDNEVRRRGIDEGQGGDVKGLLVFGHAALEWPLAPLLELNRERAEA